ncbi:Rha family transcriptional regulator [Methylomonas rapida]|uniref:Rha family transcriptional regulator n=1 Tax=Methylomonas rapida TaxID=2963939 RepID=A0ABY7GR15_9GAMM|nr:Rha family transcriptional regulator [Methylomonas rapida]WAR46943.1 Rha family transcriptional regulator [Methylomonas rapida]
MNDLVFVNAKKEAVTSHVVISEGMEVTQDSSLKLIKQYKADLEEFGRVRFQIVPFETPGGIQKRKEYLLNRDQAIFLITLMRNNPKTVEFKKQLVKQFTSMERWIHERAQASIEAQLMCETLREVRQLAGQLTEGFHYANEHKLINFAMTGAYTAMDRRGLDAVSLKVLTALEMRNAVLIGAGIDRDTRRQALLNLCQELKALSELA